MIRVNVNKIFDWLITDRLIRAANYVDPWTQEQAREKIQEHIKCVKEGGTSPYGFYCPPQRVE